MSGARPGRVLPVIVLAQFAGTSLWFAGNAVLPDLERALGLATGAVASITSAVQLGFIAGTLVFALAHLADRFSPRHVFLACAALGAIASGGVRVLNEDIVARLGILPRQIEHIAELETRELHRRETVYRGGRPLASLAGRTVILADDGLATGATMRAAVVAVRAQKPAAIIVAVPVGAPETVASIGESVDRIECPEQPDDFLAVGEAYEEFEPTTDQEVFDLLHRERGAEPPAR